MPNPADIHVDAVLSNFAMQYKSVQLLGYEVAPVVRVAKESDKYYIFGTNQEHITPGNFVRAEGAKAAEVRFDVTTSSYSCEELAVRYFLSDRRIRNSDAPVQIRMRATELLRQKLDLAKELRVQDLLQGTGGSISGATPSTRWDQASCDIEGDINAARHLIVKATGVEPNTLIISREVADQLVITLKDIKAPYHSVQEQLSFVGLPPNLFGLRLVVGRGVKNTANPGQTVSNSFIWNDTAVVCYIEPSVSLDVMSTLYTFQSQAPVVTSWRDEERAGDWIQLSVVETEKVVCASCAYRITDVLT